jgi:hypothetical protein
MSVLSSKSSFQILLTQILIVSEELKKYNVTLKESFDIYIKRLQAFVGFKFSSILVTGGPSVTPPELHQLQ